MNSKNLYLDYGIEGLQIMITIEILMIRDFNFCNITEDCLSVKGLHEVEILKFIKVSLLSHYFNVPTGEDGTRFFHTSDWSVSKHFEGSDHNCKMQDNLKKGLGWSSTSFCNEECQFQHHYTGLKHWSSYLPGKDWTRLKSKGNLYMNLEEDSVVLNECFSSIRRKSL